MPLKGRQPDKPGTFRIRPSKGGGYRVSGVHPDGSRVRMSGLKTEREAQELATRIWHTANVGSQLAAGKPVPISGPDWNQTDDWGFPIRVSDDTIASVASTLNIPDPSKLAEMAAKPAVRVETAEETEKRERRAKNARSLMDLAGIAGSAGVVMVSRRITESVDKEPVKPDPKQVNDLRDSIKETLTDMFGESEVAPWQMMVLLIFGIPISMLLQSPRRKKLPDGAAPGANLKSVP